MKKYFNKSIFKDKSFIKMICFTIVLLLVLILGNTFGYVSADGTEGEYCLNYQDYVSSSAYNSNIVTNTWFFGNRDNFSKTLYENISSLDASYINGDSYKYYAICYGNNFGDELSIYFFTDTPYYISRDDARYIYTRGDVVRYPILYTTNGTEWWDFSISNVPHTINPVENGTLKAYNFGGIPVAYSNFELFAPLNGWTNLGYGDAFTAFVRSYVQNNDSTYFTNYNYILSDNGGVMGINGLSNLENVITESDLGANPSNYMYADSSDWVLNNFSGNVWSNYNTWSVTFTSNLNQYIRDEIANLSDNELSKYYLDFDCYAYVEFYYQGVGQDVSITSPLYGNVQFQSTTSIPGESYYWSCTYKTPTDSHANLFKNINAKTFADGGYSKVYSLNTLFKYLSPNGTFGNNPISISLSDLCNSASSGELIYNEIKNDWKKFNLVCTAKIYYKNGNEEYESGSYTENFDLLTGDSSIGDSSMLTNYNPYNDNTDEQVQLPSTSTGTSTSTASTGNVTQTVTVTNDGAQYIPSLISKLIPTSLSDTGTGLVDSFSTMAQTNGFISVMASTVPAIPSTVWTYLTNYLGISLYLLACAFVLRLILDLL